MARYWTEPFDPLRHRDFMRSYQSPGGTTVERTGPGAVVYFVRECSFTFSFMTLEQLDEAIGFFSARTHPMRREPGHVLEHYWHRWFERLPAGLTGGSQRTRILRALKKAAGHFRGKTQAAERACIT